MQLTATSTISGYEQHFRDDSIDEGGGVDRDKQDKGDLCLWEDVSVRPVEPVECRRSAGGGGWTWGGM